MFPNFVSPALTGRGGLPPGAVCRCRDPGDRGRHDGRRGEDPDRAFVQKLESEARAFQQLRERCGCCKARGRSFRLHRLGDRRHVDQLQPGLAAEPRPRLAQRSGSDVRRERDLGARATGGSRQDTYQQTDKEYFAQSGWVASPAHTMAAPGTKLSVLF